MDMQEFLMSKESNVSVDDVNVPKSTLDQVRKHIISPFTFESVESVGPVLLFGAPGTGKTFLSSAIAGELKSVTCFSLSYYEIKNESIVQELFSQAEQRKPALIFLDDIEVFSVSKDDVEKRITSEFLRQLERLKVTSSSDVLVVGMTNKPWKLDSSTLQWFHHRIEMSLPDEDNRCKIFKTQLDHAKVSVTEEQLNELGRKTIGFTGSDIVLVVRDALMEPIRTVQKATHYMKVQENTKWTPCSPDAPGAVEMTWTDVKADELLEPTVSFDDLEKSLSSCRPSVDDDHLNLYAQFLQESSNASV